MLKVLFTNNSLSKDEITSLREKGIEVIPADANLSEKDLISELKGCDGYIVGGTDRASSKVIEETSLRFIIFYGAGYQDYVDMKSANAKGILVANTPKANSYTVAEHTVAMILEGVKNIIWLNNTTKEGNWHRRRSWNLQGKTLGIIGLGTIGMHVATIMKNAFEMNILFVGRSDKPEAEKLLDAKRVKLKELLNNSDVVSIHAALNDETENMINEDTFEYFKPTAVLVNMARAKIVNGKSLKIALEKGKLTKALFDGYYEEPAPKNEKDKIGLLSLPDDKFVITPHTAYNTKEAFDNMNTMVVENLLSYSTDKTMPYKVN